MLNIEKKYFEILDNYSKYEKDFKEKKFSFNI
jgi:hypothetical protein